MAALGAFGSTRRAIPVIGQGTWRADEADRAAAIDALRFGLDLGLTHIDTAEMYGSGLAETLVGAAIEGRRDEVFLVSKVLPSHASRRAVLKSCEQSLARLRTDRLDCYLLHWRGATPLAETFEAFDALERAGKILSFGVSNFDVDDLEEAVAILGHGRIACNQVLYNLEERAIEHAVLPWCQQHEVAVVAYTPFGLSPRIYSARGGAAGVLADVGRAHHATSRQVALAFLLREKGTFAIPKAANRAHVEEDAGAGALELTPEEIGRIDAAFPRGARRDLPMI